MSGTSSRPAVSRRSPSCSTTRRTTIILPQPGGPVSRIFGDRLLITVLYDIGGALPRADFFRRAPMLAGLVLACDDGRKAHEKGNR